MEIKIDFLCITEQEYSALFSSDSFPKFNKKVIVQPGLCITSKTFPTPMFSPTSVFSILIEIAEDVAHDLIISSLVTYISNLMTSGCRYSINGGKYSSMRPDNFKNSIQALFNTESTLNSEQEADDDNKEMIKYIEENSKEPWNKAEMTRNMAIVQQRAEAIGIHVLDSDVINMISKNENTVEDELFKIIISTPLVKNSGLTFRYMGNFTMQPLTTVLMVSKDEYVVFFEASHLEALYSILIIMFYWIDHYEDKAIGQSCTDDLIHVFTNLSLGKGFGDKAFLRRTEKYLFTNDKHIHITADMRWVFWTFAILHEIAHAILEHPSGELLSREYEFEADAFAYKALIELISAQTSRQAKGIITEHDVFSEKNYLAPCIFMTCLELKDHVFKKLWNISSQNTSHPSYAERFDQIINMFDNCIPEEMNTADGNKLLNSFLNCVKLFKENLNNVRFD